jgi:hypothetical protein
MYTALAVPDETHAPASLIPPECGLGIVRWWDSAEASTELTRSHGMIGQSARIRASPFLSLVEVFTAKIWSSLWSRGCREKPKSEPASRPPDYVFSWRAHGKSLGGSTSNFVVNGTVDVETLCAESLEGQASFTCQQENPWTYLLTAGNVKLERSENRRMFTVWEAGRREYEQERAEIAFWTMLHSRVQAGRGEQSNIERRTRLHIHFYAGNYMCWSFFL